MEKILDLKKIHYMLSENKIQEYIFQMGRKRSLKEFKN